MLNENYYDQCDDCDEQDLEEERKECVIDLVDDDREKPPAFFLIVQSGSIHHRNMYPKQNHCEEKILSDLEPVLLATNKQQYDGNGRVKSNEIYKIQRKKQKLLIIQTETKNTYGFSTQETEYEFETIEITDKSPEEIEKILEKYEHSYFIDPQTGKTINSSEVKEYLPVKSGTERALGQGHDDTICQYIASDIEPKMIEETNEEYAGNGKYKEVKKYSIIKNHQKFKVIQTNTYHTYGFSTQSVDYDYEIIDCQDENQLSSPLEEQSVSTSDNQLGNFGNKYNEKKGRIYSEFQSRGKRCGSKTRARKRSRKDAINEIRKALELNQDIGKIITKREVY